MTTTGAATVDTFTLTGPVQAVRLLNVDGLGPHWITAGDGSQADPAIAGAGAYVLPAGIGQYLDVPVPAAVQGANPVVVKVRSSAAGIVQAEADR